MHRSLSTTLFCLLCCWVLCKWHPAPHVPLFLVFQQCGSEVHWWIWGFQLLKIQKVCLSLSPRLAFWEAVIPRVVAQRPVVIAAVSFPMCGLPTAWVFLSLRKEKAWRITWELCMGQCGVNPSHWWGVLGLPGLGGLAILSCWGGWAMRLSQAMCAEQEEETDLVQCEWDEENVFRPCRCPERGKHILAQWVLLWAWAAWSPGVRECRELFLGG